MSTYPGSIDNGAIDVEYSPVTERIAAADQHYATQEQLKQLAADHEKELDELSRSVHALTWLVERLLKTPEDQSYVATEPPPARLVIDADSVPWDALDWCIDAACQNSDDAPTDFIDVALTWFYDYTPKPEAAE